MDPNINLPWMMIFWKNLFESLLDLENMERSGESFLERILSEVCVCVFGFGREQKREEEKRE